MKRSKIATLKPPTTTTRKYIVDIYGRLPTILCEINGSSLTKSYIYSNTVQILCQRNGGQAAAEYFYVTDRLGSVRQVIDHDGNIKNHYTYSPFGQLFATETAETITNPFKFTGQWFDSEFGQYYLRARMYDPVLMRFGARDPVFGKFHKPLTLHRYLYCANGPINRTDPDGRFFGLASLLVSSAIQSQLREIDLEFHMALYDKCKGKLDAFSIMNMQRGMM